MFGNSGRRVKGSLKGKKKMFVCLFLFTNITASGWIGHFSGTSEGKVCHNVKKFYQRNPIIQF